MKAAVSSDVIGIMLVVLTLFVFFAVVLPQLLSIITETFSKASAETVARQLSGLITASGASAYEIKIDYIPTKDVVYDVSVADRTIKIVPKFTVSYAEKASSTQSLGVNLNNYDQQSVNHFIVKKNFDGESSYVFTAKKE